MYTMDSVIIEDAGNSFANVNVTVVAFLLSTIYSEKMYGDQYGDTFFNV